MTATDSPYTYIPGFLRSPRLRNRERPRVFQYTARYKEKYPSDDTFSYKEDTFVLVDHSERSGIFAKVAKKPDVCNPY